MNSQAQIAIRSRKLGLLIRDARLAARKDVAECAGALGIRPSLFRAYEEGTRAPSLPEVEALLNKQSGLLGVSGLTNDMRELLEEERVHQDRRARLAIEIFCLRVKQYLGSYLAQMNGADAIVFTGGIGENSAEIRARVCNDMGFLGIACLLYTSPSPRDSTSSRMPSSA